MGKTKKESLIAYAHKDWKQALGFHNGNNKLDCPDILREVLGEIALSGDYRKIRLTMEEI